MQDYYSMESSLALWSFLSVLMEVLGFGEGSPRDFEEFWRFCLMDVFLIKSIALWRFWVWGKAHPEILKNS